MTVAGGRWGGGSERRTKGRAGEAEGREKAGIGGADLFPICLSPIRGRQVARDLRVAAPGFTVRVSWMCSVARLQLLMFD